MGDMTGDALVALPVVEGALPAAAALDLMHVRKVSGVLVRSSGRWRLYEAVDLVLAVAEDPQVLLDDVIPASLLDGPDAPGGLVELLPAIGGRRSGGVPGGLPGGALAVQPDLLLRVSAGPRDCYCRVDRKPVRNGTNGTDCPDGHANSVRCVAR